MLFVLVMIFMVFQVVKIWFDVSFEKMILILYLYIVNFLENCEDLKGFGNVVCIVVEVEDGEIFI